MTDSASSVSVAVLGIGLIGPSALAHWHASRPTPLGRRLEQDGIATLDAVGLPDEVLGRQTLQHHRGGLVVRDAVRQHHQPVGRNDPDLGVSPGRSSHIGNAIRTPRYFAKR